MKKQIKAINQDLSRLGRDAGILIAATVDMAGAEIAEARDRLTAALELGKDNVGCVRDSTMQKARAADAAVHEHPYKAIGVGIGVGAVIGFLATSRWVCKGDRYFQEKYNR